jgi:hypothetical protein
MTMSELEKLKAQNAELSERIAKLEAAAKPAEPFKSDWRGPIDYTEGMSMGRSAMQAMIDAVPESLMRELRADARKPNPVTQASSSPLTTTPSAQSQPQRRGTGWRDEIPLGPPPGIEHCDRLVDAQDRIDRTELAMRLAETEAALKTAKGAGDDNK